MIKMVADYNINEITPNFISSASRYDDDYLRKVCYFFITIRYLMNLEDKQHE